MNKMQIIYICIFLSFSFSENIVLSNSLSIAYDSNPLKYSKLDSFISSKYLSHNISLSARQKIFKRNTKFIFSFKNTFYDELRKKSNYSLNYKIKQSLGNYQFLTFSYKYIDDIYLRAYTDVDNGVLDYIYNGTDCYFDYSIIALDYESSFIKILNSKNKIKLNFALIYETQYYNQYFTEFDLALNGIRIKYKSSNKKNNYFFSIENINAENLTLNDNSLSTSYMDRGYKEYRTKIFYNRKLKNNQSLAFSISYNDRRYITNIIEDQLHINRNHIDSKYSVEYSFLFYDLKNKLTLQSRYRNTTSPYEWVEDLKSFELYSIGYTIYFKKIGFK